MNEDKAQKQAEERGVPIQEILKEMEEREGDYYELPTADGEPYRLYNTDHFDDNYSFHTLYGTVPVIHSRYIGSEVTAGFLWANSSDTFVDIFTTNNGEPFYNYSRNVHWYSESGALEFFVFPSASPAIEAYKL